MGIIIRQSLKSSIASYLGIAIGTLNLMVLFPRLFEEEQFGLTQVMISISMVLSQFSEFGGSNIINKYFPYFRDDKNKHNGMIFWLLALGLIFYAVVMGLFFLFKDPILAQYESQTTLMKAFYGYIFPMAFFLLMYNLLEAYARALMRITVPTIFREIVLRLLITASIVIYAYDYVDFDGFIQLFVGSYGVVMVAIAFYVHYLGGLHLLPKKEFLVSPMIREIISFGLITILTTAVWRLVSNLDIIMISYLAPESLGGVAVYTVAFYMATFMQVPQRFLHLISIPVVANLIKENDWDGAHDLFKKVSLNQFVLGTYLFLGIYENLGSIYFFLPEVFHTGAVVFLIIAAARLFDMTTGINSEIILYSDHFRVSLFTGLFLLIITIVTNYIFIPPYGITGAAIATAVSLTLFNLIKITFIYFKIHNLSPFSYSMLKVIPLAAAIHGLMMILPTDDLHPVLSILIKGSLITLIYFAVVWYWNIAPDLKGLAMNTLDKFKKN